MHISANGGGMNRALSTLAFAAILSCAVLNISTNSAYAENYPATLDTLHAKDPVANPVTSAYTLTETDVTTGPNIYKIGDKYYLLTIKDGVVSITRKTNTTDNSATDYVGHHYINQPRTSTTANVIGGVVYNNGANAKLGDIISDFVGNYTSTTGNKKYAYGGVIYNSGTIGDITGDFIGNYANSEKSYANGGVIYNSATIGDITGDFIGNSTTAGTYVQGGAIFVNGGRTIASITGNFTGNTITAGTYAQGGAIRNNGYTNIVKGNFTNNGAETTDDSAYGGAIYIGKASSYYVYTGIIEGDFIGNYANSEKSDAYGGAIYNEAGTIDNIKGNFSNNTITAGGNGRGGAIHNSGTINGDIIGDFINNSISGLSATSQVRGGAISNSGTMQNIEGNFNNNKLTSYYVAFGGAIYNDSIIENINANFYHNSTYVNGNNTRAAAIYNTNTINSIKGDFVENSISSTGWARGGAIYSSNYIGSLDGNFTGNLATADKFAEGGAIYNKGTIGDIKSNFTNNTITAGTYASGGAICNTGTIGNITGDFINNYATTTSNSYLALGGAIYHSGNENNLNLVADNRKMAFSGNYTQDYRGKINNAVFVRTNSGTAIKDENDITIGYTYKYTTPKVTLNATNNGKVVLNDNIDGGEVLFEDIYDGTYHSQRLERKHQYDLAITGDKTGVVNINNDILNANITHENVTTNVSDWAYLSHAKGEGINSLTMNSGVLNIQHLTTEPLVLNQLNLKGGIINIARVDVDLENAKMGRIIADKYSSGKGIINVNSLNLLNSTERNKTQILFADKEIQSNVRYNGESVLAYSPIYKYDVSYDELSDGGHFTFVRHGVGSKSGDFNPAVLATPVATQAAGQVTINQTFQYAFQHADSFMNAPVMERNAMIHGNEIALGDTQVAMSTDFNYNLGHIDIDHMNKGIWVKPYTSFDRTDLKHGPKVDSVSYGTLVGGDTEFRKLKHGWANVGTAYVGYFGSHLDYAGDSTTINGGLIGLTETFYKNYFFTAITATVGGGAAENHTMYGKEDVGMMMAGIASKTGYNFEFKEGKFIIQPLLSLSYSMVKAFDYTNAAGVKINSDPMHTIQINPTLRVIGNLKDGWQPYAQVGMVWNLMNETNVTANGIDLPNMHTKPYVEYGVGIQRCWKDRFSGFGQVMMRNGGRTGVALTAGFRWTIGKDNSMEKVQKDNNVIKVKQDKKVLKETQRTTKITRKTKLQKEVKQSTAGEKHVLKDLSQDQLADL